MSVISWNCRGIGQKGFIPLIKDITREYDASMIFLLEIHASGDRVKRFVAKSGFDGSHVIDSMGHSGGIIALWKTSVWKVDVLNQSNQFLHLEVGWKREEKWLLTVVYGKPQLQARRTLWDDLRELHSGVTSPWALAGDFNAILEANERKGGAQSPSLRGMIDFQNFVGDCDLVDAGFQGSPFTWQGGGLLQRLDRLLVNLQWRIRFEEAVVFHLPHFKSDHRAILVRLIRSERRNKRRRPFRFMAAWLTHADFGNFIKNNWRPNLSWNNQIDSLQAGLRQWNREVFGDVFKRKKRLMKRLNRIAFQLGQYSSPHLEEAQQYLWREYEEVLKQEEIMWYQKSRSKWLMFGDRNSRFFHGVTAIRRKKNNFEMLQNDEGQWISDQSELENLVSSFYKDLFTGNSGMIPFCLKGAFPKPSNDSLRILASAVSRQEVYQTIMNMGSFKAPGPDGLQPVFYQSQWETVGDTLCNLIMDIFEDHRKVGEINSTLITLIPKVDKVECMKQFRPISLCNVTYKTVTKILATRLRNLMEDLVSPCQCSFIPRRQSGDNIIIAQEVIHSMKKKKGVVGWMAVKIDLEKAYDRLNWEFIRDTLQDIGLPEGFINLTWECISSVRMRVLWNGEALEEFLPSRGVRQGDPLSPYLFVLCIERLFHLVNVAVEQKLWSPIQLSRGGPKLSHLAFADDLMLFAEASLDQADIMKTILGLFCESSGQKVSMEKTRIFFSKNVSREKKNELSDACGFQCTEDLGKYLGAPLIHHRSGRNSYQFILDKVNQRLSNWKTKQLSMAGRVTLAKSVLQALPSYVMQSACLPRALCDEIDRKCRNFIWGDSESQRHIHLASWSSICIPKKNGGLGLRTARDINTTFMMKAGWSLCSRKSDMWVKIIRSKYKCGTELVPRINTSRQGSNLWRGICKNWNHVNANLVWRVGNGESVNFWTDPWIPNYGCLIDVAQVPISQIEGRVKINQFVTVSGQWDVGRFINSIPGQIVERIKCITPPHALLNEDALAWNGSVDGIFSTSHAYSYTLESKNLQAPDIFSCIWKWRGPERVKVFLWKAARGILMTNQIRFRRGFSESDRCPICHQNTESTLHLFRDCGVAKVVWLNLKLDIPTPFFEETSFERWMLFNLRSVSSVDFGKWNLIFAITLDRLWWARNELVFKQITPSSACTTTRIKHLVDEVQNSDRLLNGLCRKVSHQLLNSNINWEVPVLGYAKLNCDGAVRSFNEKAACGGVLRDDNGAFLWGFAVKLGRCTVTQAELWAIIHGLKLAKERGYSKIMVESDSLTAVKFINGGCLHSHQCKPLVNEIHKLMAELESIQVSHVFREANQVADRLANCGLSLDMSCKIFDVIPDFLSLPLLGDACNTFFPRGF